MFIARFALYDLQVIAYLHFGFKFLKYICRPHVNVDGYESKVYHKPNGGHLSAFLRPILCKVV